MPALAGSAEILRFLQERATEVFETSGEFDLGAFLEQPTMERFNAELDRLRAMDGVVSTVTLVRLTRSVRPLGRNPLSAPEAERVAPPAARPVRPTRSLGTAHRGRSPA